MASAIYAALFFTVVLFVTTAYFLMGGLPLLILQPIAASGEATWRDGVSGNGATIAASLARAPPFRKRECGR